MRNCLQHSEYCKSPGDDCGCFSSRRADMCAEIIDITSSLKCENGDHAGERATEEVAASVEMFEVGDMSSDMSSEVCEVLPQVLICDCE